MATNKDVRFIIRAKDEATKTFDQVTKGFKELSSAQEDGGKSAASAGNLFGQLSDELSALSKEVAGLTGFSKMASDLQKAEKAVGRLEGELRQSAEQFAKSAREREKAASSTEKLRRESGTLRDAYEREKSALARATEERRKANAELRKSETAQRRIEKVIAKSPLSSEGKTAGSALTFVQGDIAKSRAEIDRLTMAIDGHRESRNQLRQEITANNAAIRTASAEEGRLASRTEQLSKETREARNNVTTGRQALKELGDTAQRTSAQLGGVALKQEDIAKATERATAAEKRSASERAAMSRYSDGGSGFADPKTAQAIRAQRDVVKRAEQDYRALSDMARRLAEETNRIGPPTRNHAAATREAAAAARAAEVEYRKQLAVLNQMPGAMSRMNGMRGIFGGIYGESRKAMSVFQRLRGEILSLATAYVGLYGTISNIGGVISAYQQLEAAQNRLGAVFGQDQAAVGRELGFIERQASRLGIQFGELAGQYGKFSVAARAANFTTDETRKVFLSVAEAGRVNKLSLEQMSGIFLALEQMISKGKIQSEELRRQLGDRLPGAFNIMADALGVATSDLDDMMKKGEVLANSTNLLKFADELDKRFGSQLSEALQSTTTLLGQFTNELFQAQLRVAEGGFIEGLNEALREMNEFFRSREGRDFFLSIGAALGNFVSVLAKVPEYFGAISAAVKLFVAYKLASVVMSAAGAFGNYMIPALRNTRASLVAAAEGVRMYRRGMIDLSDVMRGFYGVVRALPGLAIFTAATWAIQTLLFDWATGVDDTTAAVDEHKRIMGEVVGIYEELGSKTDDWAEKIRNVTADQAAVNLRKMVDQYEDAITRLDEAVTVRFDAVDYRAEPAIREIQNLVRAAEHGEITIESYVKKLEEYYKTLTNRKAREFVEELLAIARETQNVEQRMREAAVIADKYGVSIDEAQGIMDLFGDTLEKIINPIVESADAMGIATKAADNYAAAIRALKEGIPELAAELKKLDAINEVEENYQNALKGALNIGQVNEAFDLRQRGLANIALEDINKNLSTIAKKIIGVESGGSATAKNPNSTATGAGQFIESTWVAMFKKYFPQAAAGMNREMMLELRKDSKISSQMVEFYAQENAAVLQKAGVAVNEASIYLAHFLGPQGALNLLKASGDTPVSQILGADQINANKSILQGKTAKEVYEWAARKMNISEQELAVIDQIGTLEEKRIADAKKLQDDLDKQTQSVQDFIASKEFELKQNEMIEQGLGRQAAIEAAIQQARQQKKNLTEDEIEAIARITGQLYDQQNARSGIEEAEKRINDLYSLRSELMQQIEFHQGQGEHEQANALKGRLEEINAELREAIANTIAMHQAMGGPGADLAIAKLQNMANSIQDVGQKAIISGEMIADRLSGALTNAFKAMAQAIANGEDAWEAFANAFLQSIAEMLIEMGQLIIKTMLMRAISGFLGVPMAGATPSIFHGGGIAGAAAPTRSVGASIFSMAMRYHEGGIAGLLPGEVPAILKEGEEILTEDNPRHIGNAGAAPAPTVKIVNSFDSADVLSEALSTPTGEQAFINVVKRNAGKIRQMIG